MHLLFHCQERHNCWHHYLPPSNFTKWTLSGVLGHIKNHFFPSINMHFSLTLFLNQLWVDVFFTKLQHSGGRSVCTAAAPHNTPQNTSCVYNKIFVKWSPDLGHLWIFKTKAKFEECCCIVHFYQVFEMFLLVIHDLLFIQLQTAVVSLSAAPLHEVPSHKKVESNKQS